MPNIRRIGMIFGEPLDFSRYQDQAEDRLVQRKVTDEIMFELMRVSGQEYVDEYAAVVKLRLDGKQTEPAPEIDRAKAQEPAQGPVQEQAQERQHDRAVEPEGDGEASATG
jgi:1-acyl-sn-glycerol-3-phosphate acyltransferase